MYRQSLKISVLWLLGVLWVLTMGLGMAEPALEPKTYRVSVDAINPTGTSNPKGAKLPGYRGEHQVIIYTPAYGEQTQTAAGGLEAIVENDHVLTWQEANSTIPQDGYVVSGVGLGADAVRKFLKPGARVTWDDAGLRLLVQMTPHVYALQVAETLAWLKSKAPVPNEGLQQAEACYGQLQAAEGLLTPTLAQLANQCQQLADTAFYQSVESVPNEFRGTWLRPSSKDPQVIRQTVSNLKAAGIQQIFLETYYQGKTLYPSKVMGEYGLPEQHAQFQGGDPMQLWIDEAHRQGLKVHAWVQVFFAGNARESLETYGPILQKYPQWRNVQRQSLNNPNPVPSNIEAGHYFLDPAHPEVRMFLTKLLMELVNQYPIDGLNLDYIRYPSSAHPDKPTFSQSSWGYTDAARQQFKSMLEQELKAAEQAKLDALKVAGKPLPKPAKTAVKKEAPKLDPVDLTPADPLRRRWMAWRKQQITSFVQNVAAQVHAVKPDVLISAVVFPQSDPDFAVKLQEWPKWVENGSVQALTPIGLSTRYEGLYQQSLQFRKLTQDKVPVYVGLFGLYNRVSPLELVRQIDTLHQAGMPGLVLFDGARLNASYIDALNQGPFRP